METQTPNTSTPPVTPAPLSPTGTPEITPETSSNKKWFIIGGIIVALGIAAVVATTGGFLKGSFFTPDAQNPTAPAPFFDLGTTGKLTPLDLGVGGLHKIEWWHQGQSYGQPLENNIAFDWEITKKGDIKPLYYFGNGSPDSCLKTVWFCESFYISDISVLNPQVGNTYTVKVRTLLFDPKDTAHDTVIAYSDYVSADFDITDVSGSQKIVYNNTLTGNYDPAKDEVSLSWNSPSGTKAETGAGPHSYNYSLSVNGAPILINSKAACGITDTNYTYQYLDPTIGTHHFSVSTCDNGALTSPLISTTTYDAIIAKSPYDKTLSQSYDAKTDVLTLTWNNPKGTDLEKTKGPHSYSYGISLDGQADLQALPIVPNDPLASTISSPVSVPKNNGHYMVRIYDNVKNNTKSNDDFVTATSSVTFIKPPVVASPTYDPKFTGSYSKEKDRVALSWADPKGTNLEDGPGNHVFTFMVKREDKFTVTPAKIAGFSETDNTPPAGNHTYTLEIYDNDVLVKSVTVDVDVVKAPSDTTCKSVAADLAAKATGDSVKLTWTFPIGQVCYQQVFQNDKALVALADMHDSTSDFTTDQLAPGAYTYYLKTYSSKDVGGLIGQTPVVTTNILPPAPKSPTITEYSLNGTKNPGSITIEQGTKLSFVLTGTNLAGVVAGDISLGLAPKTALTGFVATDTTVTFDIATDAMTAGNVVTITVASAANWKSNSFSIAAKAAAPKSPTITEYSLNGTKNPGSRTIEQGTKLSFVLTGTNLTGVVAGDISLGLAKATLANFKATDTAVTFDVPTDTMAAGDLVTVTVASAASWKSDSFKIAAKLPVGGGGGAPVNLPAAKVGSLAVSDAAPGKSVISFVVNVGDGATPEMIVTSTIKITHADKTTTTYATFVEKIKDGVKTYDYSLMPGKTEMQPGDVVTIETVLSAPTIAGAAAPAKDSVTKTYTYTPPVVGGNGGGGGSSGGGGPAPGSMTGGGGGGGGGAVILQPGSTKFFKFPFKTAPFTSFKDVQKNNAFGTYITILSNGKLANGNSVINGYPGGQFFGPDDTLTRSQWLKMVMNSFQIPAPALAKADKSPCKDVSKANWAAPYFTAGVKLGLVDVYDDGTCKAEQPISRGDATELLFLAIAKIDGKTQTIVTASVGTTDVNPFKDIAPQSPVYKYIVSAEKYGFVKGVAKGYFAPNQNLTRGQATKILVQALGKLAVK